MVKKFGESIDALFRDVAESMSISVLVVDDSLTMRRIISICLEKMGNFNIINAENGLEALNKLHDNDVKLIISDWNMPEMNGIDFVKAVRALERYNSIPILMVTSVNFKKEVYEAVKSGVNGYLVKPFKEEELLQKIKTLMKYK